jgi:hypothetical protein
MLAAGCSGVSSIAPPPASNGRADFSNYVALGTSVSMGYASGGLADRTQLTSAPALIAAQTAADVGAGGFVQPLVALPGIPSVLLLTAYDPPTVAPAPYPPSTGTYVPRPARGYDNLAVSGALVTDALTTTAGAPYFDLVLQGQGTMVRQAVVRNPTFITVELGSSEVLRPLLAGGDPSLLVPPATFRARYAELLDSLVAGAPNAEVVVANLPRVTALPFAAAVPLDLTVPLGPGAVPTRVRLRDGNGPLPDGSLVLLTAIPLLLAGYGQPDPSPPLPDSLVITLAERAAIESAIDGDNAAIAQEAAAHGCALVDEHALFERLVSQGITVSGVRFTTAWPAGGLISLDGIHPSSVGSGALANAFLDVINARFGARIPPVELASLPLPTTPLP